MPIRWNPARVRETLDRLDEQLASITPQLQELLQFAESSCKTVPNLPGYITDNLRALKPETERFLKKCHWYIDRARQNIPDAPISKSAPEQSGPKLF